MKLTDFKVLTFDCYGTLIDWETGIWNALQPLLGAGGVALEREDALARFARYETEQEDATPSLRYPTLLAAVHARFARDLGVRIHADLNERFGASVPDWPAFPEFSRGARLSQAALQARDPLQCRPPELRRQQP